MLISLLSKKNTADSFINRYHDRDLSWLTFNKRVLNLALNNEIPLLERLKFLGITSKNLDEFYMTRVGNLKLRLMNKNTEYIEKLQLISLFTQIFLKEQYRIFYLLLKDFEKEKIYFVSMNDLSSNEVCFLEDLFHREILPVIQKSLNHSNNILSNLANGKIHLAIYSKRKGNENSVKHPEIVCLSKLNRIINISTKSVYKFVFLEDVIRFFREKLYENEISKIITFRITKRHINHSELHNIQNIKCCSKKKYSDIVRIDIEDKNIQSNLFQNSITDFIHKYYLRGPLDLSFLLSLYTTLSKSHPHLLYEPLKSRILEEKVNETILDKVSKEDILLHHPYDSFNTVIKFINEAALDPYVREIKQSLYRVDKNSKIIDGLIKAAKMGKKVTVFIELRARFDEKNNKKFANILKKAGCKVLYGKSNLKLHSKLTLITRLIEGKLTTFVHLATGNYNESTAKIYTDIGLITTNPTIGDDVTLFFNQLEGKELLRNYKTIYVSPINLKSKLISLIDVEIKHQKSFHNGLIIAKMNSLTDKELIDKLYQASNGGVRIELLVRGACCLRPGVINLSENIKVKSIVGRFLEHSRVYYFYQNGKEELYCSSADMMDRNMNKRFEILFPILDPIKKLRIKDWLDIWISDNVNAYIKDQYGGYQNINRNKSNNLNSHIELFKK